MSTVHLPLAPAGTDLPPLYARWVEALLGAPVPGEPAATCDACVMSETDPPAPRFAPGAKCCTFLPALPNFTVGRILGDEATDPAGRASVRARVASRDAVSPLGLGHTARFRQAAPTLATAFGQAHAFLCPHFDPRGGGRCGIWAHREGVCATWYCRHARGLAGKRFWNRLQQLLSTTEQALARWCVVELDVGAASLAHMFPPRVVNPDGHVTAVPDRDEPTTYEVVWGRWLFREEEFYRECARLVSDLAWGDVLAVAGPDARVLARLVVEASAERAAARLPASARLAPLQVLVFGADRCVVHGYSVFEPVELPRALFDALHCFDGRPLADAIAAVEARTGEPLPDATLQRLLDHRVLLAT